MMPMLQDWLETLEGWMPTSLFGWASLLALVSLLHYIYFTAVPYWAVMRFEGTRPRGLRRYLEWVVRTPSLLGSGQKLIARLKLTATYLVEGRHAEAVAHGQANLEHLARFRHRPDILVLEADVRNRLADSFEALGRVGEAREERGLAAEALERAPVDSFQLLNRGKALERQNRHAEACELYERSLAAASKLPRVVQMQCIAHLFLASFNAGRPAECLRWAEEAIAQGAKGQILRAAHRMAGIASGNLGRLDEAEAHTRTAYDVSVALKDKGETAEILGSLADIQRRLGQLEAAHEAARQAAALHPKALRMSQAVQAHVLNTWGQYDEALAMLRRYDDAATKVNIPALERRVQAVCALDMSKIEAECGRVEDAWMHIQQATAELGNDAKLGLKCDSAAAWVCAVRGMVEDSRRVGEQAKAQLPRFEQDPSTRRSVSFDLGMAAWVRGDHAEGEECWTSYLDLGPDPVYRPTALYVRGECRRSQGDTAGAKADFHQAIALHIDTHHARLAQQRLREVGPI